MTANRGRSGSPRAQVAGGEQRAWLLTEDLDVAEAEIAGWLTHERSWFFWVDGRGGRSKRRRGRPSIMALHLPSDNRLEVAVYCRPRPLRPTETLDVSWLPAGWVPCVWHPGMRVDVCRWLTVPVTAPPGVVDRSGARST
jgi:hypothetical protein